MLDRQASLTERRVFKPVQSALWAGYAKATAHLDSLTDAELWQAEEWLRNMGTTNCGWLEYRLRDDLLSHVKWIVGKRTSSKGANDDPTIWCLACGEHHGTRPCPSKSEAGKVP